MNQQTDLPNWRKEIEENNNREEWPPALKLEDNQSVELSFTNEGIEFLNKGKFVKEKEGEPTIAFFVNIGENRTWYVKKKQFELLNQIHALGFPLRGKKAILTRKGVGLETRYQLVELSD